MFGWFGSLGLLGSLGAKSAIGAAIDYATDWRFYLGDAEAALLPWAALSFGSSVKTRVNSAGLIESLPSGSPPRIDYDPVTIAALGLLVEGQSTNLAKTTDNFSAAAWTKSNVTVTTNAATAPDGTLTADRLAPTGNAAVYQSLAAGTFPANSTGTFSVWLRSAIGTSVSLGWYVTGSGASPNPQLGNLTVTNDWRRFSFSFTTGASNAQPVVVVIGQFNTIWVTGEDVYAWGAQIEVGAVPTSYIPNTGTGTAVRVADDWYLSGSALTPTYSAAGFTWFADVTMPVSGTVMCLSDGTTTNQILVAVGAASVDLIAGASTVATIARTFVAGERLKIAMTGDGSEAVLAVNGSTNTGSAISSTIRSAISRGSLCAVNGATMAATGVRTYRAASGAPVKRTAVELAALTA